jgi:hypothetical protein
MHGIVILISPKRDDNMVKGALGDKADYSMWEGANQIKRGETRWESTFTEFIINKDDSVPDTIANRFSPLLDNFDMTACLASEYTEFVVVEFEPYQRNGYCIVHKKWEENPTFTEESLEAIESYKERYAKDKIQDEGPLRVFLYDYHY